MNRVSDDLSRKIIAALVPLIAALFLGINILAQPGDEAERYQRSAQKIKELDAQILVKPNNADLYFQRGLIYLNFFGGHPETVEFRGVVYTTDPGKKALDDLNRAIELESRSEFYASRGRFFQTQWGHKMSRESEVPEVSWARLKTLLWMNESFDLAIRDYQTALDKSRNAMERTRSLSQLAWIYRSRATSASSGEPGKTVRAEKQTQLVFDDYDRSVQFITRSLDASEQSRDLSLIRDVYLEKARAADRFDDPQTGIRTLTDGLKAIKQRNSQDSEHRCSLYILRGDLFAKVNDLDAAIGDYTYPIDNKYFNCDAIYEKRGDAFAAREQWRPAIEDYTREITKISYPADRILEKRAKAYVKSAEPEKALSDLNEVMRFKTYCTGLYQLRAQAYRLLNKDQLADEDERTAAKYSKNRNGCNW